MTRELHAVLGCIHVPYHDKGATRAVLAALRRQKPDVIHLLGDVADCYTISMYNKDPARKFLLVDEARQVTTFLDRARDAAPGARFEFYEGNHEDRLRRYIWAKCPELAKLPGLDTRGIYGLTERNIGFHDYRSPVRIGQLWLHHGEAIRKYAGWTARAAMLKTGGNVMVAHSHRQGYAPQTTWEHTLQGWEIGCLCRLDPEYIIGRPDWQQGFALLRLGREAQFGVDLVRAVRGKCWIGGEEYKP